MSRITQELIIDEPITALQVFNDPKGLEPFIAETQNIVSSFKHDMSTASSRKKTASLAAKVSKLKVSFDNMGKELTEEWKQKSKKVDASRKAMREKLDAIRDEARKPLTEWENTEKEKQAAIKAKLDLIQELVEIFDRNSGLALDKNTIQNNFDKLESLVIDESYGEHEFQATKQKTDNLVRLHNHIKILEKEEQQIIELNKLREEKEKRDAEIEAERLIADAEQSRKDQEMIDIIVSSNRVLYSALVDECYNYLFKDIDDLLKLDAKTFKNTIQKRIDDENNRIVKQKIEAKKKEAKLLEQEKQQEARNRRYEHNQQSNTLGALTRKLFIKHEASEQFTDEMIDLLNGFDIVA